MDVSSQRCGFQLGTMMLYPAQLAGHFVEQFAQSPDQDQGLGGIVFTHLRNRCTCWPIWETGRAAPTCRLDYAEGSPRGRKEKDQSQSSAMSQFFSFARRGRNAVAIRS